MPIGSGVLKLAGGLGTVAVIGGSAAAVAADTKPPGAPLKPPVNATSARVVSQFGSTGSAAALNIPITPVCQKGTPATGVRPTPTPAPTVTLDPTLTAALHQLQAAKTAQQRHAAMASLTPDQRMQLTAYLAAHRAQSQQGTTAASKSGSCRGVSGAAQTDTGSVAPTVVDGGSATPLVVSAVS